MHKMFRDCVSSRFLTRNADLDLLYAYTRDNEV